MTFGLTLQGFNPARIDDVKTDLEDAFKAAFGQNVRLDAESVDGQMIGIFSERFAILWELAELVYSSAYVDGASGAALDDLVARSGVSRREAKPSTVLLELGGTVGTPVPVGSLVSSSSSGTQWVTTTPGLVGIDPVLAEATVTGPTPGLAGTIDTIDTPIAGWATVTNTEDADKGRNEESDASLRERFRLTLFSGGGSSVEAIRGVLLRVDNVDFALVVENATDTTDAEGRPPHSFEAIVVGGDEQDIADAIWFAKPAGIQAYGVTQLTFVTDLVGDKQTIGWTRPADAAIWIEIDYEVLRNFPDDGEDEILAAILDYGETLQPGDDFFPWQMEQRIDTVNMQSLTSRAGFSANPTSGDPLPIDRRQHAKLDSSRVKLNRIN